MVRPLVADVPHSAALIGPGSEVLAFDTGRSAECGWGPRVVLFVGPDLAGRVRARVDAALPGSFGGHPVVVGAEHGVQVSDPGVWFTGLLGFDPLRGVGLLDWLSTPWQRLAEVTCGEVFHDGLGVLERARGALRRYPPDVERYVLAGQWRRLAQRETFPGRCGEVGDGLGSALVTAELAGEVMRLVLLMRRRYPPYAKWLGSAFVRLPGTAELGEALSAAVAADDWRGREEHLGRAYRRVAALHDRLGVAPAPGPRGCHRRPFRFAGAGRFADALSGAIVDERVRALPPVGSIDQFGAGADLLTDPVRCRAVTRAVLGV
ncbi:hypothetical protein FHS43_005710 [Streptosporangium becharense]|uniref:DUF4037 domain-containing protein n=1 Tax=Streptosporangium becharense TaxID=1816182 RepID=A0A7W9MJZ2_9ACTN|nr:DUF4037 domain-containing protein [Streptosporangium becharense]MBB2914398.1 hypothetical protein [Streptosporangium becharense]MBB5823570.1 hypothetical protein [Streptosporangium becharense]